MDKNEKKEETNLSTKQQNANKSGKKQDLKKANDSDPNEISPEQKNEQDSFFRQFSEFTPLKKANFLSQDYESRLNKNIDDNSSLFQYVYHFYKSQHKNAEKIKDKILLRLNDFQYSMNHLSIISNFFQSYSSFQNFCNSAQINLSNPNFPNPPYQIFESSILLNILDTHRNMTLKNLLFKFKHFSLIRRKDILTIAVDRFICAIKKENTSVPLLTKTKEHTTSELSRLSQCLGITYDIESYDGQRFIYACETILSEYQRLHFSFNLVPENHPKPSNLTDRINDSFMQTFSKNDLVEEAFNNIVQPNGNYTNDLVDNLTIKKFPREHIVSWVTLRFCRNRQLLSEIEKSTMKLFQCFKNIYEVCKIDFNIDDRTFCDKYISFLVDQTLISASAVFLSCGKKADLDPLLEILLEKFLLYTNAKIKILSLFVEIAKHSNSEKVKEITDMIINRRPNLIFQNHSFFELFDTQIETLEKIANCISIILNIQILNERQITSFYGSFFEHFQFGTFYENRGEGEFNISKFEVYLSIEKVLDFFTIAPKIVSEICSTMSIKDVDYSNYIEFGVWSQLLNEIKQYPEVSIFGTDFSTVRFNLSISKNVESLINCQLLDDPLFLKSFEAKIDPSSSSKSKFTQNLTNFCFLAFKLRSLIYKTNLYLSLYFQQYEEFHSTTAPNKTIDFIGKSFDFSNYEEIEKLCSNGDFSEIIEIVNCQRRYNIMLMIAIQHNNFRSDNELISFLFHFAKQDNVFAFTKAETNVDEDIKFYQNAAKRFFVGFDSFFNQDFGRIFFDISTVSNFADSKKLTEQLKKYMYRIELATITNYERIILHDFQQIELFSFESKLYHQDEGLFDYFSIPGASQCLLFECDNTQFSSLLTLISIRIQLLSFIRFNMFLKYGKKNPYYLLYTRKITWESNFLSKMNSNPLKAVSEAFNIINAECLFELGRFQLSILQLLQKVFTTKKDDIEKVNLLTADEIREMWKIVNQELDPKKNNCHLLPFNNVSIERYIPIYLSNPNFTLSDTLKNELLSQCDLVDKQILQSIILKDPFYPEAEMSEFVYNEIINELLKFTLIRLHTNVTFSDLNVLSLVDITRAEYKENLHFYTNFFVVPGTPQLPKVAENRLLKNPIVEIVEKDQKKQSDKQKEDLANKLKVFDSINSLLKPDIYVKKTKFENQKLQPYNPTPENAKIQFDIEMRFANSKIVSMIIQAINHSIISEKPLIFSTNSNMNLNLNSTVLISELTPLSYYLNAFLERSQPQVLKTWLSYTEIMKEITFAFDQGEVLEKLFKKKFHVFLNFQLWSKYFNDFIKLARLREIEKTTNKEYEIFVEKTTKETQDEYEDTLNELSKENQELMKQYQAIRNKLVGLTGNIIQKQKDKIPENDRIMQPRNEEAQKSLDKSKEDGFTLEADDLIRNEIFSSSSSIEDPKKSKEEEDDTEEFPTFNFASFKVSRDDSAVAFTPVQPPPRLPNKVTMRRNTMIRPGARALLLAKQNALQQEKEKEKEPEPEPPKPGDEIRKQIERSKEKYKEIESELPDLKKMILKLRITRTLFRIATSKNFKKGMNTLSREKKEASTMFWSNRKIFEEDLREMEDKIDQCCKRLLTAEIDTENLKNDLDERKKETTKLAHWKEFNLKTIDQIMNKIESFEKGPNVDVNKLLKTLDHKRAELDTLYMEEESFDNDLYYKVTQPLQEISRVRRFVQSEQYNFLKMQQTAQSLNDEEEEESLTEDKRQDILDENLKLNLENKRLKSQIALLERKDEHLPPIQYPNSNSSELPQLPTARRIRSSYVSARARPTLTPRSLYSNRGYRTIKRP